MKRMNRRMYGGIAGIIVGLGLLVLYVATMLTPIQANEEGMKDQIPLATLSTKHSREEKETTVSSLQPSFMEKGKTETTMEHLEGEGEATDLSPSPRAVTTSTWGTVPWSFDSSTGTLTFTGGGTLGVSITSPWLRTDSNQITASTIKKIVFTQKVFTPSDSSSLFGTSGWTNNAPMRPETKLLYLESFENLNYLDTSNATDMHYMFAYAGFYAKNPLITIDVSSFDTSKVTNMQMMFGGVQSTTTLNVSHFNTSNVTNFQEMFWWMKNLTSLDLSSFDFSRATNITGLFSESPAIKMLTLPPTFRDTSYVTALPAITPTSDYSGSWANQATNASMGSSSNFMKTYDGTAPGTYIWQASKVWGDVPWDFDSGTGTLTFTGGGNLGEFTTSPWNRTDSNKIPSSTIKKIVFTQKVVAPSNSTKLFGGFGWDSGTNGPSVTDDKLMYVESFEHLEYLDTSNATDMSYMFAYTGYYAENPLTTLNVSSFNTGKATNMQMMFGQLRNVMNLDVTSFDTSNVTNMIMMFIYTSSLTSLDASSFTTSKVTNMSSMFSYMTNLTTLNLSKFDTKTSSPNMTDMFAADIKMASLTLGADFRDIKSTSNLPTVVANDTYTGNWILTTSETPIGTSTQFMQKYDGTKPGTYIWELTDSELTVNYYIYDGKETTQSIFSELSTRTRKVATTDTVKKNTNIQSYINTLVPTNDHFTGYTYTGQYRAIIDDTSQTSITDPTFPTNKKILLNLYFTPVLTITGVDEIDFGIQELPKKVTETFPAVTPKGQEEVALQVLNTYETTDGTGFQPFELSASSTGLADTTTLGGATPLLAQLSYTTAQGLNTTIQDTATSLLTSSNYQETIPLARKGTSSEGLQLGVRPNNSEGTYKGTINWQVKVGP